jgi:hypothetical protein
MTSTVLVRGLIVMLAAAHPVGAQDASATIPRAGTRVRLESSSVVGIRVIGELSAMNQGFVSVGLVKNGASMDVPWTRVASIQASAGRVGSDGAIKGALAGLGAASVMFYVLTRTEPATPFKAAVEPPRLVPAIVSFGVLPATGVIIGLMNGPERWRPVAWRPTQDTVMLEGEMTRLRLTPGRKVSLRSKGRWIRGSVLDASDDSLALGSSSSRRGFAWADVSQLSMQAGRSRLRGATLGITVMSIASIAELFWKHPAFHERPEIIGRNLALGAGVGALVGRQAWSRIPVPVR